MTKAICYNKGDDNSLFLLRTNIFPPRTTKSQLAGLLWRTTVKPQMQCQTVIHHGQVKTRMCVVNVDF